VSRAVDAYLDELGRLLPPGRRRHRALAEAADHLLEAEAAGVAAGADAEDAAASAVERFGPAPLVAARFAGCWAVAGARAGAAVTAAAQVVIVLGFLVAGLVQPRGLWADDAGPEALRWSMTAAGVAGQVAAVAAVVTLARLVAGDGRVRVVVRGAVVACGATAAAVLATVVHQVERARLVPGSGGAVVAVLVAAGVAAAALVLAAAALRRAASAAAAAVGADGGSGAPAGVLATIEAALHRRPWLWAVGAAAAGFVARVGLNEARAADRVLDGTVEAVAVLVGFALLGPVLGLRPRARARAPAVEGGG
jgi:hypothetical protein